MSDYSKTTNFTAKDALASGDPNKVIKGSEHDTEYDNISTAVATKANKVASPTDGNLLEMSASGDLVDSGILNTAGVLTNVTSIDGNAATANKLVDTNGLDAVLIGTTASAVNEVTVTNAATGNSPTISATGDDTNIDLDINSKGTGRVNVNTIPVYGLVLLDTPVLLVTDTTTAAVSNTPVDITSSTTGVAVKAILNVFMHASCVGVTGTSELLIGEGDETLTTLVHRAAYFSYSNTYGEANSSQITVNLASGEIFDYEVLQTGTAPISRNIKIYLAGYYV